MANLFTEHELSTEITSSPLAERMRPTTLKQIMGQEHILGPDAPLSAFVRNKSLPSLILWGSPGTGKTTLAKCLASEVGMAVHQLSAVDAGVKELRSAIAQAVFNLKKGLRTILFIDEIHRFSKSQQDALLHAVERGDVVLIGATTENPSFSLNNALLSRCRVFRLADLSKEHISHIIRRAQSEDAWLRSLNITYVDESIIIALSGGDARETLNILETAAMIAPPDKNGSRSLDRSIIQQAAQQFIARYDKNADHHYNTISAFIKSVRGSDPDAALLYLAMMINAGEDPLFIARRLLILASEDIGNADPQALSVAMATFQALERIGMPEGRIVLSQATTYLAMAPKSNACYVAIENALNLVRSTSRLTIPHHLHTSASSFQESEGNARQYRYPHDEPGHFVADNYFPPELQPVSLYQPSGEGAEVDIADRLQRLWPYRESSSEP